MRHHIEVGRWGEDIAIEVLQLSGFQLLERNWRPLNSESTKGFRGEIDAVMIDREQANLVFLEVKTRSTSQFGSPFEAIDATKAHRLKSLAYAWCKEQTQYSHIPLRIDAVAICGTAESFTFEHLKAVS